MGKKRTKKEFFCNRKKDLKILNNYLDAINNDISIQLLVTRYRGVGKTFLLKKILNNQLNNILTTYVDLSKVYGKNESRKFFFWLIRIFSQTQDNVSYIFTGSVSKTSDIIEMINGQTGAFGGRMVQVNIDPFTKEETKNYLKDMKLV